jgi:SAM-dependent methyltransferase
MGVSMGKHWRWVAGLGVVALALTLGYWLLVVGELTYLGRYAVRFIYQRGARFYDQVRVPVVAHDAEDLLPLLAESLAHRARPQTLDVATGTGRVPLLLASLPWFGGVAHGLDFSPAMLVAAALRVQEANAQSHVLLHHGEAGTLLWPNDTFDLVTCLEALEYFPRPRRALAEQVRVLRPGGTLIVSKYPDDWARLLPGKALSGPAIAHELRRLGMAQIHIRSWQPGHYDLVIAVKHDAA